MKYSKFVALVGIISSIHLDFVTCNEKQPPPLKLDWKPFHVNNKSGEDSHPLFTKEEQAANEKNAQAPPAGGGLLGGVGGLLGGLLGGGGGAPAGGAGGGGAAGSSNEFFAKFDAKVSDFKGIASLVKDGFDLVKLFGLGNPKDHGIIIDNRCSKCSIFIKCGKDKSRNTGDINIAHEDGSVIKFQSSPPSDAFDHYVCQLHDLRQKGRWVKIDAYGGKASKSKLTLIEVKSDQVVRLMKETGSDSLRTEEEIDW